MREQMKYYIAFAENSIEGHLESGPRRPHGDQEQIRELIAKLQNAQVRLTDQLQAEFALHFGFNDIFLYFCQLLSK